jgi:ATP-dependent DNA ligase
MLSVDFQKIHKLNRYKKRHPVFISLQHPKNNIPSDKESVAKMIAAGWWGQKKINGYRCQIHITNKGKMTFYTRQGNEHTRPVSEEIKETLENLIPAKGINVFDAEWQSQLNKMFMFDIYRQEGQLLKKLTFEERYQLLRAEFGFLSPRVEFLPVYKRVSDCMRVLGKDDDKTEGLVFRYPKTPGWQNASIMRCLTHERKST